MTVKRYSKSRGYSAAQSGGWLTTDSNVYKNELKEQMNMVIISTVRL